MKYAQVVEGYPFPNEVKINLNMLGPLMLNWIGGHVDRTDVVAIDKSGPS